MREISRLFIGFFPERRRVSSRRWDEPPRPPTGLRYPRHRPRSLSPSLSAAGLSKNHSPVYILQKKNIFLPFKFHFQCFSFFSPVVLVSQSKSTKTKFYHLSSPPPPAARRVGGGSKQRNIHSRISKEYHPLPPNVITRYSFLPLLALNVKGYEFARFSLQRKSAKFALKNAQLPGRMIGRRGWGAAGLEEGYSPGSASRAPSPRCSDRGCWSRSTLK